MTSRLVVDDVHFARGAQAILHGVSFEQAAGQVFTLLGPSGSGKTTLLWLLAGLLAPDRGSIGYESAGKPQPTIGFVFQDGGLWEHLRVHTHLELVLHGRGLSRRQRRDRAASVLESVGLARHAERRPGELSGGERQRLALARALVVAPQWLLLDEPTSQLDGPSRQELIDLLDRQLRHRPVGVVLATHQVDLALRLSDCLAVLTDGRIAQCAAPADVYERPTSLAVARLLGPAFELVGEAQDGILMARGRVLLNDLPRNIDGLQRIILRPNQVAFQSTTAGPAVVGGCHYAAGVWHLRLRLDGYNDLVWAASPTPVEIGGRGRLVYAGGGGWSPGSKHTNPLSSGIR